MLGIAQPASPVAVSAALSIELESCALESCAEESPEVWSALPSEPPTFELELEVEHATSAAPPTPKEAIVKQTRRVRFIVAVEPMNTRSATGAVSLGVLRLGARRATCESGHRMGASKRPSIPVSKRPPLPRASSRGVEPPVDLAKRLSVCEAEIRELRSDVDTMRGELLALRVKVEKTKDVDTALAASRPRKVPPPLLTNTDDEIIAVDASEVILESIRPPAPRRPSKG